MGIHRHLSAISTIRALICGFFIAAALFCTGVGAEDTGARFTSFAGFNLGTGNFAEVQKVLGPTKMVATGDAGEYTASLCYSVPGRVILFFAGEMDGPNHDLGGFGLARETDRGPCSNWPSTRKVPRLSIGGLHLGMSLTEFSRRVGTLDHMEGQTIYAFFESKRKMSREEFRRHPRDVQEMIRAGEAQDYYDVDVSVIGVFDNGRLREIRVWKTETE